MPTEPSQSLSDASLEAQVGKAPSNVLGLESLLPFGKYGPNGKEGHTKLRVAIMADARYIRWLFSQLNVSWQLDEQALSLLDKQYELQQ